MTNKVMMVTIELSQPDHISDLEFFDIRQELTGLMISVNGRQLKSALDAPDSQKIFTCFEINPKLKQTVEDYLYLGLDVNDGFNPKISFELIEQLIEPAEGIFIA